jgi:hypothetical protein
MQSSGMDGNVIFGGAPPYCNLHCTVAAAQGAFLADHVQRMSAVGAASALGLLAFGITGSALGGARVAVGALRVLLGGLLAMAATYGIGVAFGVGGL